MSGEGDTAAVPAVLKRSALPKAIVAVALVVIVLIAGVFVATRYGVLTPQARLLIEARTDGLRIGRFGRLKIEGLSGDVWRDFRIRRLTIRDEKGAWLEAKNVHLVWRYGDLLSRRFTAELVETGEVVSAHGCRAEVDHLDLTELPGDADTVVELGDRL